MKKVVFILCFISLCFNKLSFADNLHKKAEDFILKNEVSGVWRLKAYKDTKWTICNGITYYIVEKQMKGGVKGHKCKPIDKNNLQQGYVCEVKKSDILLLKECKKQSKIHINYIINKLSNKLLIGKSGANWWHKLNDNQKVVLIDVLFNYGETSKKIKNLLSATMDMIKHNSMQNQLDFYTAHLSLCQMSSSKLKYQKGQDKRCNRRLNKFLEEM